jgi:hypothetical protein
VGEQDGPNHQGHGNDGEDSYHEHASTVRHGSINDKRQILPDRAVGL